MFIVLLMGIILVIFYQRKLDEENRLNLLSKTLEACLQDALTVYSAELVEVKILSRNYDSYRMHSDWLGSVLQLNSASDEGKRFLRQAQSEIGYISAKNAYLWALAEYACHENNFPLDSQNTAEFKKLMTAV